MSTKKPTTKTKAAKKAPSAGAAAKAEGAAVPAAAPDAKANVGQVVRHSYFDHYSGPGGQDVTRVGIVVDVDPTGARVAWLTEISDPIALDELH